MSTNFYWRYSGVPEVRLLTGKTLQISFDREDPRFHIGKSTTWIPPGGDPNRSTFVFAQDPEEVCGQLRDSLDAHVVEDEYGKTYSGREMLAWIVNRQWEMSIGAWFS